MSSLQRRSTFERRLTSLENAFGGGTLAKSRKNEHNFTSHRENNDEKYVRLYFNLA